MPGQASSSGRHGHGSIGPYPVQAVLGRGGMGVVYRALDVRLGRSVAVKVVGLESPLARARFEREVRALARLSHPNIVPVHATGEHNGLPYVVMELVEGSSLEAVLARRHQLPETEALRIALPLARALAHAHAHDVVHRDVKPANVLLGVDGVPRLTDFGLALDLEDASRLSVSGASVGSPAWWAPEQAGGDKRRVGPATDVFGLGATLFHMLAGRPPHEGGTLVEMVASAVNGVTPLAKARPGVRRDVAEIVDQCLALAPEDRFLSMELLAETLETALAGGSGAREGGGAAARWTLVAAALMLAAVAFAVGRITTAGSPSTGPPPSTASAAPPPSTATPPPSTETPPPRPTTAVAPPPTAPDAPPPDELGALLARGRELRDTGRNIHEALALAQRAVALHPEDGRAHGLLGTILVEGNQELEGIAHLRRALAGGATGAELHAYLGRGLVNVGPADEALVELERAIAEDPRLPEPWADRAILRHNLGQFTEALADADHALQLQERFARAHFVKGTVLAKLDRPEEAVRSLDRSVELSPDYMQSRRIRAGVLNELGRFTEAVAELNLVLASGAEDRHATDALVNRGYARANLGDFAGARKDLDRALELDPNDFAALRRRARLLGFQEQNQEALADVERLLAMAPDDGEGLSLRGAIRMNLGRFGEALVDMDAAARQDPLEPNLRLNRAQALLELGRPAEAEPEATFALQRQHMPMKAYMVRGRARLMLARLPEALDDLNRSVELGAMGGTSFLLRGETLLALGRRDEARRDLEEACRQLRPDSPEVRRARELLGQLGR